MVERQRIADLYDHFLCHIVFDKTNHIVFLIVGGILFDVQLIVVGAVGVSALRDVADTVMLDKADLPGLCAQGIGGAQDLRQLLRARKRFRFGDGVVISIVLVEEAGSVTVSMAVSATDSVVDSDHGSSGTKVLDSVVETDSPDEVQAIKMKKPQQRRAPM